MENGYNRVTYGNEIFIIRIEDKIVPNCQACNHKWSFIDTFKIGLKSNGKKCPNCGEEQYISKKSRTKISIMTLVAVMLGVFVGILFEQDFGVVLISLLPMILAFMFAILYSIELSNTNEPMR